VSSGNFIVRYRMKDLPREDRPRERLLKHGPSGLSTAELLSIIMGTGNRRENAYALSSRLLASYTLRELSEIGAEELKRMSGIKDAKACRLLAAVEIGKRIASYQEGKKINICLMNCLGKVF